MPEDRAVLADVVAYLKHVMQKGPARRFCTSDEKRPLLVFTDGAYEPEEERQCGAGAVIWDTASKTGSIHEVVVPPRLVGLETCWENAIDQ